MIIGQTSKEFSLLTSCDSKYLHDHAKEYITSCALSKNNVHLHVTNPSDNDMCYMNILKIGYNIINPQGIMTLSSDKIDISNLNEEAKRVFFSCNRFIVAPYIMNGDVLITDVDCIIMNHIDPIESDIGLYLRDSLPGTVGWEKEGTRVAAGAVFCSQSSKSFLQDVSKIILENDMRWFIDQVALYRVYQAHNKLTCTKFDESFMDWEFVMGSKIWTGKGERKHKNEIYVRMKNMIKNRFPNIQEEYWK